MTFSRWLPAVSFLCLWPVQAWAQPTVQNFAETPFTEMNGPNFYRWASDSAAAPVPATIAAARTAQKPSSAERRSAVSRAPTAHMQDKSSAVRTVKEGEIHPLAVTGSDSGNAIVLDSAGNAFVTGSFWNSADTDVFVAKFDPSCNLVNFCQIPSSGPDSGNAIALDSSGHVYVAGSFSVGGVPQAFLAVFDLSCNLLCLSLIPSAGPGSGNAVAVDRAGNAFVTGSLNNGVNTNAFLTKFDSSCNQLCPTVFVPGGGQDSGNGVAVDFNGNAYLTGSVATTSGAINLFVAKYDTGCSPMCMFTLSGPGPDSGNAISLDRIGNAYVTGSYRFLTGPSAFLAQFDPYCVLPCFVPIPLPGSIGRGIAVNADGSGYLTGSFPNAGSTNAFTATFSASCQLNCVAPLPSTGAPDSGNAVAIDGQGLGYLTGSFSTGAFTNAFVTKVDQACNLQCPISVLPNPN